MAFFEVFIPSLNAGVPGVTLTLEAPNWIGALRTGLHTIGEGQASISNVMCDIREDKSIHVTDVASHRVFRLREVAAPGAASAGPPPAPVGAGSESSGGKTLVEFRRPDLSMPPASSSSPAQPTAAAVATQAKPSHLPAPVKIPSARGHHVAAADDEPDTIETERATRPEIPRRALGLDDASLPGPAVSPPSPPPPAPSPARATPTLLSTPILRPTPVPLEAPTGTSSKAYDLTLRQPKAPAFSDSLADALDDSSVGPVLSSPSAVRSAEQRTESGLTPLSAAMPPPMTTPPVTAPPAELSERTVTASMSSSLLPSPLSPLPSASPLASSAAEGRASAASARRATTGAATQPAVALESGVRARSTASTAKASGPVSAPTPRGTPAPPPKRPSGQFEDAPKPVRREVAADNPTLKPAGAASAEAIADAVADVFDATQSLLMEGLVEPRRVAEALLDVALAHVPAESGSFYLADLNGHVLSFAAVRGPKAAAIIRGRYTVPVGQGIIGFCALEGVCLRVADMQKDPHYASEIANAVGYDVKDTLCASAEKDGRLFGAIQLINSTESFTSAHMEVLRYIGLTAAQLLERHAESV